MRGREYLFFTVMSFSPRKSIQGRRVESFFLTKKKTAPRGDDEGRMRPEAKESWMYVSIASFSGRDRL